MLHPEQEQRSNSYTLAFFANITPPTTSDCREWLILAAFDVESGHL
jgi:hypothetical protein